MKKLHPSLVGKRNSAQKKLNLCKRVETSKCRALKDFRIHMTICSHKMIDALSQSPNLSFCSLVLYFTKRL